MSGTFHAQPGERTARTPHSCSVCFRKIEAGERYTLQNSYQDGWVSWRTCSHCEVAVRTAWNLRLLDEEYDTQSVFDALADHSIATARMAVGIRRKWLAFCGYRLLPVPTVVPRRCIQCADPVNDRSQTWCERHDAERIERVSRQLADLAAAFPSGRS